MIERLTLFNLRAHNLAREEKRLISPRNPLKKKTLKKISLAKKMTLPKRMLLAKTLSNQVRKMPL